VLSFTRPAPPPPAPGRAPVALYRVVDAEYFETLRIRVLAGRVLEPGDREGAPRAIVISQRMADQFWPGEDPIGRPIQISGQEPATVVGVVTNVRSQAVARQTDPEMYVPHAQTNLRTITYAIRSAVDSTQVQAAAREVVRRTDARLPLISPGAMSALVDEQLARPRFYLLLLSLFAVLAVALAAVGVYGVVAYVVTQRTREIGLRMALGATPRQVVGLMLWQGLRPAVLGRALGLGVAVAAGRLLQGLLYEVQPHDPMTLISVSMAVLAVVMIACGIPARRASAVAPSDALRAD
jgi:predicted permease